VIRIIAGRFRGRRLCVPDIEGLRPTGNRVRETLFNWLQAEVSGAHCLDLFAGTGALGFEALSRHASSVTLIESNRTACRHLENTCRVLELEAPAINLVHGTAQATMAQWAGVTGRPRFDIAFIDPPFSMRCQWQSLHSLVHNCLLAPGAHVYVETSATEPVPEHFPPGCELIREKRFGDVVARLLRHA